MARRQTSTRLIARSGTAFAAVTAIGALAACGGGGSGTSAGQSGSGSIKVWIQEDLPDRVKATQAIVSDFTKVTGVKVDLVPVAEDQFNQLLTTSAGAGDLPDVIGGISLPQVRTLSSNKLIDTATVGSIVDELKVQTFSKRALDLTSEGSTRLAVPSESWAQLLFYRKDLLDKAGLKTPSTYADITAAAKALNTGGMAGFVGATAPGDAFTEQTFEHVALGNNCQLVDNSGKVTFDSPQCQQALQFYGDLVKNYSVKGAQDVDTTRAAYFSGKAAMFIWSTFVLDEMAGLRKDALPNCPQCKGEPAYLAKNTGVVATLAGPSGSGPAAFGEITSWTVTDGANAAPAAQFVKYLMSDGYMKWIAIAPEGKVPVRLGTPEAADTYSKQWAGLKVGVDSKAPLSQFYSPDVIKALTSAPDALARWAIPQGQGNLLGNLQGTQPIAKAVNQVASGQDPAKVAASTADAIRSVQK